MSEPASQRPGLQVIRAASWRPYAERMKHVFLAGNLQAPVPHPFFRRTDVELIVCEYAAGDLGLPHWHTEIDEIELIISGCIAYRDVAGGQILRFEPGDVVSIPHGVCVERLDAGAARTLTIKVPSRQDKIHCRQCRRTCSSRLEEFQST